MSADSTPERLISQHAARLTELELQMMHLQRDFETLNEVVLELRRETDKLNEIMRQMGNRLTALQSKDEFDPEKERPPHY